MKTPKMILFVIITIFGFNAVPIYAAEIAVSGPTDAQQPTISVEKAQGKQEKQVPAQPPKDQNPGLGERDHGLTIPRNLSSPNGHSVTPPGPWKGTERRMSPAQMEALRNGKIVPPSTPTPPAPPSNSGIRDNRFGDWIKIFESQFNPKPQKSK